MATVLFRRTHARKPVVPVPPALPPLLSAASAPRGSLQIQYFNRAIDGKLKGTIKLQDIIGVPSALEDKVTIVTQKRTYK